MKFDTLNETETLFGEIAHFYACLASQPLPMLDFWKGQPTKANRVSPFDALPLLESRPNAQRKRERRKQYEESPQKPYLVPVYLGSRPMFAQSFANRLALAMGSKSFRLDESRLEMKTKEVKQIPPAFPIDGNDVRHWLSPRIRPLRYEIPKRLRNELREPGNEDAKEERARSLTEFARLLDCVTEQVDEFEGQPVENLFAQIGNGGGDDWPGIFAEAKRLVPDVRKVVEEFRAVIERFAPSTVKIEVVEASASAPLVWKGTQKNLAELFVELENKGWVEPIQDGERSKIARQITHLFDLSKGTKKTPKSNPNNSFSQIFGNTGRDKKNKEPVYPQIFTEKYKRQFESLPTCEK